jgi:hypothetical protein
MYEELIILKYTSNLVTFSTRKCVRWLHQRVVEAVHGDQRQPDDGSPTLKEHSVDFRPANVQTAVDGQHLKDSLNAIKPITYS